MRERLNEPLVLQTALAVSTDEVPVLTTDKPSRRVGKEGDPDPAIIGHNIELAVPVLSPPGVRMIDHDTVCHAHCPACDIAM